MLPYYRLTKKLGKDLDEIQQMRRDEITTNTKSGQVYLRTGSFVSIPDGLDVSKKKELDSPDVESWRSYGAWWASTQPKTHYNDPHYQKAPKYKVTSAHVWPFGKDICHLQGSLSNEDG